MVECERHLNCRNEFNIKNTIKLNASIGSDSYQWHKHTHSHTESKSTSAYQHNNNGKLLRKYQIIWLADTDLPANEMMKTMTKPNNENQNCDP